MKLYLNENEIRHLIINMANLINSKSLHGSIAMTPILDGAYYLASDLSRLISYQFKFAPIIVTSYQNNKCTNKIKSNDASIKYASKFDNVIVVDTICDTGATFHYVCDKFKKYNPSINLITVSLLLRRTSRFMPTIFGQEIDGDEYLVGYGLDNREILRNLTSIYKI